MQKTQGWGTHVSDMGYDRASSVTLQKGASWKDSRCPYYSRQTFCKLSLYSPGGFCCSRFCRSSSCFFSAGVCAFGCWCWGGAGFVAGGGGVRSAGGGVWGRETAGFRFGLGLTRCRTSGFGTVIRLWRDRAFIARGRLGWAIRLGTIRFSLIGWLSRPAIRSWLLRLCRRSAIHLRSIRRLRRRRLIRLRCGRTIGPHWWLSWTIDLRSIRFRSIRRL